MVSSEKTGAPGSNSGPPPLPLRPTSPAVTTPLHGGFGFASASTSSLNANVTTPGGSSAVSASGGRPSSPGSLRLSAQHERLILELLPFKDASQFREWLAFLEGDWEEYCRDYLDPQYFTALYDESGNALEIPDKAPSDPEPDKATTAQRAKDAINNQSVIFLTYHPEKTAWTPEDHAVRFVATAIADSLLRKVWGERDWRKKPLEIAKALYEVLSYKRAGYVGYQQQLWMMRQQQRQQLVQAQAQGQAQTQQQTSQQQEAAVLERLRRQHQPVPARRPHPDEMNDNPPDYNA